MKGPKLDQPNVIGVKIGPNLGQTCKNTIFPNSKDPERGFEPGWDLAYLKGHTNISSWARSGCAYS
jgi:hypothetical protein